MNKKISFLLKIYTFSFLFVIIVVFPSFILLIVVAFYSMNYAANKNNIFCCKKKLHDSGS